MASISGMPDKSVKKFHPDGTSKEYRGHSVVGHLPFDAPLRNTLNEIHAALSSHELRESLFPEEALLPPESWHMTVFICVRDLERGPDVMPRPEFTKNDLNAPYETWLEYTRNQLLAHGKGDGTGSLSANAGPPYELTVCKAENIKYHISIPLEKTSSTGGGDLRAARDELSSQTGIRFPQHDSHRFHITLAYMVREPSSDESAELIELVNEYLASGPDTVVFPSVALCSFQNMQGFDVEVELIGNGDDDDDEAPAEYSDDFEHEGQSGYAAAVADDEDDDESRRA